MQKYKCHKVVEAFKIASIDTMQATNSQSGTRDLGKRLFAQDGEYVEVSPAWDRKHTPEIGGYFVRYKDGYESYSPAEAFEEGYTPVSQLRGSKSDATTSDFLKQFVSDPNMPDNRIDFRIGNKLVGQIVNIKWAEEEKPAEEDIPVPATAANPARRDLIRAITILRNAACLNSKLKGFHDDKREDGTAIALMHSELSEALEALRVKGRKPESTKIPGFLLVEEEMADVLIRVFDFCGQFNYRLGEAVLAKMDYNHTRPHKHGKNF